MSQQRIIKIELVRIAYEPPYPQEVVDYWNATLALQLQALGAVHIDRDGWIYEGPAPAIAAENA